MIVTSEKEAVYHALKATLKMLGTDEQLHFIVSYDGCDIIMSSGGDEKSGRYINFGETFSNLNAIYRLLVVEILPEDSGTVRVIAVKDHDSKLSVAAKNFRHAFIHSVPPLSVH